MQLQQMTDEQLKEILKQTTAGKAELEKSKAKLGNKFPPADEESLLEATEQIDDINAILSARAEAVKAATQTDSDSQESNYVVKEGEEDLVHAEIIYGENRYDSKTRKQLIFPYVQTFTTREFETFKAHADNLGYEILRILHQPTK